MLLSNASKDRKVQETGQVTLSKEIGEYGLRIQDSHPIIFPPFSPLLYFVKNVGLAGFQPDHFSSIV